MLQCVVQRTTRDREKLRTDAPLNLFLRRIRREHRHEPQTVRVRNYRENIISVNIYRNNLWCTAIIDFARSFRHADQDARSPAVRRGFSRGKITRFRVCVHFFGDSDLY